MCNKVAFQGLKLNIFSIIIITLLNLKKLWLTADSPNICKPPNSMYLRDNPLEEKFRCKINKALYKMNKNTSPDFDITFLEFLNKLKKIFGLVNVYL